MSAILYTSLFGAVLVLIVSLVWSVRIYNRLIQIDREVDKSWQNIEVVLKQRNEELPNLIDVVAEYMEYEEKVFQNLVKAREAVKKAESPEENAQADNFLRSALDDLFARSEEYPELKASEPFMELQSRITALEERIADRREVYNDASTNYNIIIQQFPDILVARNLLGWEDRELWKTSESARQRINEDVTGSPEIEEDLYENIDVSEMIQERRE